MVAVDKDDHPDARRGSVPEPKTTSSVVGPRRSPSSSSSYASSPSLDVSQPRRLLFSKVYDPPPPLPPTRWTEGYSNRDRATSRGGRNGGVQGQSGGSTSIDEANEYRKERGEGCGGVSGWRTSCRLGDRFGKSHREGCQDRRPREERRGDDGHIRKEADMGRVEYEMTFQTYNHLGHLALTSILVLILLPQRTDQQRLLDGLSMCVCPQSQTG